MKKTILTLFVALTALTAPVQAQTPFCPPPPLLMRDYTNYWDFDLETYTWNYMPTGRVDTLYTYVTNGSRLPFPVHSELDDAPCAFRFGGDPDQGKVLIFTFPVYWWTDGAADSLGQRAIDWFWEDVP